MMGNSEYGFSHPWLCRDLVQGLVVSSSVAQSLREAKWLAGLAPTPLTPVVLQGEARGRRLFAEVVALAGMGLAAMMNPASSFVFVGLGILVPGAALLGREYVIAGRVQAPRRPTIAAPSNREARKEREA